MIYRSLLGCMDYYSIVVSGEHVQAVCRISYGSLLFNTQ